MNSTIEQVTERIQRRSAQGRAAYLERMHRAAGEGPLRGALSCSNLAHGFAACGKSDKHALAGGEVPNIAIVSAYNDMLSAHQPFASYPQLIKRAAAENGAVAQFAGGPGGYRLCGCARATLCDGGSGYRPWHRGVDRGIGKYGQNCRMARN